MGLQWLSSPSSLSASQQVAWMHLSNGVYQSHHPPPRCHRALPLSCSSPANNVYTSRCRTQSRPAHPQMALQFSAQVVGSLPQDAHDQGVDLLVTPDGMGVLLRVRQS